MDKILIVDDDQVNLAYLSKMLADYEVNTVHSASEMWEMLSEDTPSLILLDVVLPDGDGFEIARELAADLRFSEIPVIFISAKVSGSDVKSGFDAGGYDYVKKPVEKDELTARIQAALKRMQEQSHLRSQSISDPLTGLCNSRYFAERLATQLNKERRQGGKLSIAMIDLDRFKEVNDCFGHPAGSHVLVQFADIIKKSIRSYDLAGRYGGDEFIILFDGISRKDAAVIMGRIKQEVEGYNFIYCEKEIPVFFSCGIADLHDIGTDSTAEGVIITADKRLYEAKKRGRNVIVSD